MQFGPAPLWHQHISAFDFCYFLQATHVHVFDTKCTVSTVIITGNTTHYLNTLQSRVCVATLANISQQQSTLP